MSMFPAPLIVELDAVKPQTIHIGHAQEGYIAEIHREDGLMPDDWRMAHLFAASPALLTALMALLPEVDSEIEQRQTSGNDEHWQGLKALSDAAHAAVAKAEGRNNG